VCVCVCVCRGALRRRVSFHSCIKRTLEVLPEVSLNLKLTLSSDCIDNLSFTCCSISVHERCVFTKQLIYLDRLVVSQSGRYNIFWV
jgi:hypothetical protein